MMAPDPLRSVTSMSANPEDTSLALPTDRSLSSGRQRVLNQVQTITRSKSKKVKNGTASPTSSTPTSLPNYNEFGTFKFKGNPAFGRSSSTMLKSVKGMKSRSQSTKERYRSTSSTAEQQAAVFQTKPNGLQPSRSDPALAPPFSPAVISTVSLNKQNPQGATKKSTSSMANGMFITTSQTRIIQPPSNQSQYEEIMGTNRGIKTDQASMVNIMSELTLEEAVACLSSTDESHQLSGASFIQHSAYSNSKNKVKVYQLKGISPLVALLESPNTMVSHAAVSALRNLVYQNPDNKKEVQDCGISKALLLLKTTDSTETQKQVTGLLWNLSSDDMLKNELTETALPALTKNVIVPFTTGSNSSESNITHVDPVVFFNATNCLRNLSNHETANRNKMRDCPMLIDSLSSYIDACVAEEKYDDKSLENCVSIFNNLTFQLEIDCPEVFVNNYNTPSRGADPENAGSKKSSTVGCFSPRSSKAQRKLPTEQPQETGNKKASGVRLLSQEGIINNYLTLLEKSKSKSTKEACCGALQNLTAGSGDVVYKIPYKLFGENIKERCCLLDDVLYKIQKVKVASDVSKILLEKLKPMCLLPSMLFSDNQTVQQSAVSLLDNMSRISSVQSSMAKQMMPSLTKLLKLNTEKIQSSDRTVKSVCNTLQRLMLADSETSKKCIDETLVAELDLISNNKDLKSGSKAASELLLCMMSDKNLQGILKKKRLDGFIHANNSTKTKPSK